MSNEIMNDREVATLLKMPGKFSYKTVQTLLRQGKLRGQKIGGEWRIHAQAVEDFLMMRNQRRA